MMTQAEKDRVKYPIEIYLEEIDAVPLLTHQEEINLAIQIKQGDESALERMIQANLRLVVHIARNFTNRAPLPDLISEGNIGLLTAVRKFDETLGTRFSTYATYWIKQAMHNFIEDRYPVLHIPRYLKEFSAKLRKVTLSLAKELGTTPTDAQCAEALGLTPDQFAARQKYLSAVPKQKHIVDDESTIDPLMETLEGDSIDVPGSIDEAEALAVMMRVIMQLSDDERMILKLRTGILGSEVVPSTHVAEVIGISPQALRMRVQALLKKIKILMQKKQ